MTKKNEVRELLAQAERHLFDAQNALTGASVRADYRTASAISRSLDAVQRAQLSIPYVGEDAP
jgi:hypothetical protein